MKTRIHSGFIALILLLTFVLTGCGNIKSTMPGIVFVRWTTLPRYYSDDTDYYSIAFYDKDGKYFTSDDPDVCALSFAKLINEYESGNLTGKIDYVSTCDTTELSQNFKKLRKLAANKNYELTCPDRVPAVEPDSISSWYGLYYDKSDEIKYIMLYHNEPPRVKYEPNDKRAAEISDWAGSAFKPRQTTAE